MIEQLQLRRWCAFDNIDLTFERGTTFVVAPNGIGKTSLLLGMAWAIFGDHSRVNAHDCIRAGATSAEAEVTLLLENGCRLIISRTVKEKGKSTSDYKLDGMQIDEHEAETLLCETFRTNLTVAARLSMMMGGGHVAAERALDLEDHLYQVFGVTKLRGAADRVSILAKTAVKQRESIRSFAKQRLLGRDAMEAELQQLTGELEELRTKRAMLASALNAASEARDLSAAWKRYQAELLRRQAALVDVVGTARNLGLHDEPGSLSLAIDTAAAPIRAALAEIGEHVTDARAKGRAARAALALLKNTDPSCPTCLRPFHGPELAQAIHAQEGEADQATDDERRWREAASEREEELFRLDKLRQALAELPPEPAEPHRPLPDGDPNTLTKQVLESLKEHDTQVGRLEHERDVITSQLAADDDVQQAHQEEWIAYRHEAVTRAAAMALANAADQLTRGYIEPLSQQIRWRWKALFGEGGLQLRPDGTIVRLVGERELPWDTLSGGERIWARLVTNLLVLATSTRLPFAWFDEPLEHLDPRARRAVAAALATATRAGGPKQLIVTTYEHAIARQLTSDIPEASIRYVRRSIR